MNNWDIILHEISQLPFNYVNARVIGLVYMQLFTIIIHAIPVLLSFVAVW